MNPLLVILIAWLLLSIPFGFIAGTIAGSADRARDASRGRDSSRGYDPVPGRAGERDGLIGNLADADTYGRRPNYVSRVTGDCLAP